MVRAICRSKATFHSCMYSAGWSRSTMFKFDPSRYDPSFAGLAAPGFGKPFGKGFDSVTFGE